MTSTPRFLTLIAAGALALGLSACSGAPATSPSPTEPAAGVAEGACTGDEGLTVVVDASALGAASESWCYPADATVAVADAIAAAGIETEGTTEYGDQVVCRVNGMPSATEPVGSAEDPAYVESCASMPAAFAYWSLWAKPAGGTWDYAAEGLATLTAEPGDAVELLFTLDGAPAAPAA